MTVDIPAFKIAGMVSAPREATHFRLMAVGASIDFDGDSFSVATSESAYLPLRQKVHAPLRLIATVEPASVNPLFLVFGIEYLQLVNGEPCALTNGSFNAMAIVKADGSHRTELTTTDPAERSITRPLMPEDNTLSEKNDVEKRVTLQAPVLTGVEYPSGNDNTAGGVDDLCAHLYLFNRFNPRDG